MSTINAQPQSLQRMPTGLEGLDLILNGGLFRRGIYLITGTPGTGKTILGNQICFNRVAAGEQVIYITLLTETHADLFAFLESLSFFDRKQVARNMFYFNGYDVLEKDGLTGLRELIRKIVFDKRPSLLVIDTLVSAELVAESDVAYRKFIKEIHTYTQAVNCTTLLLTHRSMDERSQVERTMIDGLIELDNLLIEERGVRYLRVQKLRGSPHLQGRHVFEITQDGLVVHPRIEAVHVSPSTIPPASTERMRLNIADLDAMLHGGIPYGSVTMLVGTPGSGKTVLGDHFLAAGAQSKQPAMYLGFYEMPSHLVQSADQLGFNFSKHIEKGLLEVMWQPQQPDSIDALLLQLLETIRQRNIKRLFIDGLVGLQQTTDNPERFKRILVALMNELRALEVTTLISVELPSLFGPSVELPIGALSTLADNIIYLRPMELHSHLEHLISILKVRNSNYDRAIRRLYITDTGLEIGDVFTQAQGVLTGLPQADSAPNAKVKPKVRRSRKK